MCEGQHPGGFIASDCNGLDFGQPREHLYPPEDAYLPYIYYFDHRTGALTAAIRLHEEQTGPRSVRYVGICVGGPPQLPDLLDTSSCTSRATITCPDRDAGTD